MLALAIKLGVNIPGAALLDGGRVMLRANRSLVSCVQVIRMHGQAFIAKS